MHFRLKRYVELMSKEVIQPEKMPPTNRAAFFHGLKAHYQIVVWKMLNDTSMILNPKIGVGLSLTMQYPL